MKKFVSALTLSVIGLVFFSNCNDPLQIGTEFVGGEDEVDFFTTDTISIEASTVQLDSAIAFQPANNLAQTPGVLIDLQQVGWVGDPLFGEHRSSFIFQLIPENTTRPRGIIDSVRLTFVLDSLDNYGIENATFDLSVSTLIDSINATDTFYTDQTFTAFTEIGSNVGYMRSTLDSSTIIEINNDGNLDTLVVPSIMSIPIDIEYAQQLFDLDSVSYINRDVFLLNTPALILQQSNQNGAFLPLRTLNTSTANARNKLSVFYTLLDGEPRQYDFLVGGATFSSHEHDYSTGTLSGIIGNPIAGEDILAVQAGGGPTISIRFPYKESLSDLIVNEAILELVVAELPSDNPSIFPLPQQLYGAHIIDGANIPTNDVILTNSFNIGFEEYGGQPIVDTSTGSQRTVYRFNISDHLQKMISGEVSDELLIRSPLNASGINRAVFYGTDEGSNSVRLILTYSEI